MSKKASHLRESNFSLNSIVLCDLTMRLVTNHPQTYSQFQVQVLSILRQEKCMSLGTIVYSSTISIIISWSADCLTTIYLLPILYFLWFFTISRLGWLAWLAGYWCRRHNCLWGIHWGDRCTLISWIIENTMINKRSLWQEFTCPSFSLWCYTREFCNCVGWINRPVIQLEKLKNHSYQIP